MLFNSISFLFFLPVIFFLYWFVFRNNKNQQNFVLILASYIFYAFWDWRFLFLLGFSTLLDYLSGIFIADATEVRWKKIWMRLSIFINLSVLCYFKYVNFFIDSIIIFINSLGFDCNSYSLNILLPIGISFYTFHGISYVLDNYYGRIRPTRNFIEYSLFVSYFPLLVAGPIERATHLLPQLGRIRSFSYNLAVSGTYLIIWGFFKKLVIADNLAPLVDAIFNSPEEQSMISLIFGAIGFAFQVYGDFSGYTDIARGVSRLFGIELILNFNFPYFSKSIPEFWSRWHISLSSWLNDYVFTPLALQLRHYDRWGVFFAVFTTFLISGFWHGAGFSYIAWGAYHGFLYVPYIFSKKGLKTMVNKKQEIIGLKDIPSVLLTFVLVSIGYILFRSESIEMTLNYLRSMNSITFNLTFIKTNTHWILLFKSLIGIGIMFAVEYLIIVKHKTFNRYFYLFLLFLMLILGSFQDSTSFIYFQF
jgi:alginate O-acetyltransferase complex protein AlgI